MKINVNPTDKLVFDLKIDQIDYNEQKKNALRKEIATKYGVPLKNVEINVVPLVKDAASNNIELASDIISNIQDPKFQVNLFEEYLKLKDVKDVKLDDIKAIDAQVNALVDYEAYSKYKTYKFKYVKWSNYLSYGEDNYFDFTKLHGLVLLNGSPENQCGKTTFAIDLLRFALFGKAQKSPTLDSVFNIYLPEATEVVVEAGLEINSSDYVIRRTVTRPSLSKRTKKSKCKQKLEYFKLVNGDYELIDNCEGENTSQTNNIIRESVGTVDDFNLVISATAYTLGDLLRMGQSDKGKLFSRWLGLLSIENKEEIAKNLWKKNISPKLISNTYDKETLSQECEELNDAIVENKKEITQLNGSLAESEEKIKKFSKDKADALSNRKNIKKELTDVDVSTLTHRLNTDVSELEQKRGVMHQLKEQYYSVKDAKFDEAEYTKSNAKVESLTETVNDIKVTNAELKVKINALKAENERINNLVQTKKCPTCGQPIDNALQTKNLNANNDMIDTYIAEGLKNKERIDKVNGEISSVKASLSEMESNQRDVRTKNELELKMVAVKTNIDNLKLMIGETERKMAEIEENKENIRLNNEIDLKIGVIEESILTEQRIKEDNIRKVERVKNEVANYTNEIKKRKELINKLIEEEKIIRNWSIYQELVGKNGIVKIVLRRALPVLNNEITRLLKGLCDFNVEISVSEDNKVCMDLVRGGQRLDLGTCASGFETVMASIAVRHALSGIATMAKPNFTVFDEVLDGVAVSNYENVRELFRRMTKAYDFILHITHNELISDWHDNTITVTKNADGVSVIRLK